MSLSFSTTSRSAFSEPALLSASKAMPAVMAPSPITATTRRFDPSRWAATAMPSAALIEVLEWPTPKVSYSLSARLGNGARPSFCLMVVQPVAPAGQHLVRIGLVADVPHQPIVGGRIDVVQGDRQLDGAEAGGEVATAGGDAADQVVAQFGTDVLQLRWLQPPQIRGGVDARKQGMQGAGRFIAASSYTRTGNRQRRPAGGMPQPGSDGCGRRCSARARQFDESRGARPSGASAAIARSCRAAARRCASARPTTLG